MTSQRNWTKSIIPFNIQRTIYKTVNWNSIIAVNDQVNLILSKKPFVFAKEIEIRERKKNANNLNCVCQCCCFVYMSNKSKVECIEYQLSLWQTDVLDCGTQYAVSFNIHYWYRRWNKPMHFLKQQQK